MAQRKHSVVAVFPLAAIVAGAVLAQPVPLVDTLVAARGLLDGGQLERAHSSVAEYLAKHPESGGAHFLLGEVLFREQKPKESLAAFTTGARFETPGWRELQIVGMDYVLLKAYSDADKWFTRAATLNPKSFILHYYLGRTKYQENLFEDAIREFEQALAIEPENGKAEDNRGLCLEAMNQLEQAERAYRNAITWQAKTGSVSAEPYYDLGGLYLAWEKPEAALAPLEKALELAPGEAKMQQRLGKAFLALNRLAEAREVLERAVQLDTANASSHYLLQQAYRKLGRDADADRELATFRDLQRSR